VDLKFQKPPISVLPAAAPFMHQSQFKEALEPAVMMMGMVVAGLP